MEKERVQPRLPEESCKGARQARLREAGPAATYSGATPRSLEMGVGGVQENRSLLNKIRLHIKEPLALVGSGSSAVSLWLQRTEE